MVRLVEKKRSNNNFDYLLKMGITDLSIDSKIELTNALQKENQTLLSIKRENPLNKWSRVLNMLKLKLENEKSEPMDVEAVPLQLTTYKNIEVQNFECTKCRKKIILKAKMSKSKII